MEDRAEQLRKKIAAYRRRLAEGVGAELAKRFLEEILDAEAELAAIDGKDRRG